MAGCTGYHLRAVRECARRPLDGAEDHALRGAMRLLLALALSLALAAPAAAQERRWAEYRIEGGCLIVLRRPLAEDVTATWTPNCVQGQPVSGRGQLSFAYASTGRTVVLEATFVAGVPHGDATMIGVTTATGEVYHRERANFDMGCDTRGSGCIPYAGRP